LTTKTNLDKAMIKLAVCIEKWHNSVTDKHKKKSCRRCRFSISKPSHWRFKSIFIIKILFSKLFQQHVLQKNISLFLKERRYYLYASFCWKLLSMV